MPARVAFTGQRIRSKDSTMSLTSRFRDQVVMAHTELAVNLL